MLNKVFESRVSHVDGIGVFDTSMVAVSEVLKISEIRVFRKVSNLDNRHSFAERNLILI